ncbi:MAG TPA: 1,4-alpha-glucan branching enzyme, partial [Azonexus sp.]|nr:1,4-alpha-glucan branching enzyme [Azonexus sp.]
MNVPLKDPLGNSLPAISPSIMRVQAGTHHDPFEVLGVHPQPDGSTLIRAFLPAAEAVEVAGGSMTRIPGTDCFERILPPGTPVEPHPVMRWQDKGAGAWHTTHCPYSFAQQLGEMDLYLLGEGRHFEAWKVLGARLKTIDGVTGCQFAVWAPAVQRVSVIGDFNDWDGRRHPMRCRGTSG